MYRVRIGEEMLDLADLSEEEINERLRVAQNTGTTIHCQCFASRHEPQAATLLQLWPSRRGTNYHLRRAKGEGEHHHKKCRHRSLSEQTLATMGLTSKALRITEDGCLHISLQFGLGEKDEADVEPTLKPTAHRGMSVARTRASLLGLLHVLWSEAGLDTFRPKLHQAGPGPWVRLRQVARRTVPNKMRSLHEHGLSSILLLPLQADQNQNRRNYAKLFTAHKKRRLLFACELDARLLEKTNRGGYADLTSIFGVNVTIHNELISSTLNRFASERCALKDKHPVIAFGIATVGEWGCSRLAATIENWVLMGVTDCYVPVESSYERAVGDWLERHNRAYQKPLRYDSDTPVHPDFILCDTIPPLPMEVYGMNSSEYLARKAEKEAYYRREFPGRHWSWNVLTEPLEQALSWLPSPGPIQNSEE